MSEDGSTQVGKISKQWSGFLKETFTDADMFGVSFPMDLDVKIKAVLIGAVFLIVSAERIFFIIIHYNKIIIYQWSLSLYIFTDSSSSLKIFTGLRLP